MVLEEFYKKIKNTTLYPGSLDELNLYEKMNDSGKVYELLPKKGLEKYIRGIIIPSKEETKERSKLLLNILSYEDPIENKDELDGAIEMLENEMLTFYNFPGVTDIDLRLKAKKIGADGLINITFCGQTSMTLKESEYEKIEFTEYMGVPIRLKK